VIGSAGEKIWIATVMVRGNEVQLGKYPSQTEAKRAIDEHYENNKRKVVRARKSGSKTTYSKEGEARNSSTEVEEDDGSTQIQEDTQQSTQRGSLTNIII